MKYVLKFKWLIMALWLVAAVGLFISSPNMEQLVREKGQIDVPKEYSSSIANQLLQELNIKAGEEGADEYSSVLVFHNPDGLSAAELEEARQGIEALQSAGETYGITSVTSHFEMPELEQQMVAEDGKTILALVNAAVGERTPSELREAIYAPLEQLQVQHYYTGNWLIGEDVIQSSQEGLKKTEFITLIFIMAILFLVFRSAVAPIIPLLTVGLSYLLSQSVVAYLVHYADFPLSNFTQIFMVAVMFGIGTDYCILLISRFKEELVHSGGDKTQAVLATYKTAGKTVLYAGLAVLVGFSSIGFSTFVLYRSAVAVAVGVAVLLIALVTVVPFFMSVLGTKIFWPAKGSLEHKQSKLWGRVGSFSLKRPLWSLLILAIIIVPFLSVYKGSISFNSLDEIGDKYDSVKAFQVISDSFGPGDSLPTTVVVKTAEPLDTPEGMAAMEQISRELAKVPGVKTVRSATRPTGEALQDFEVAQQVETLGSGLDEGGDGLSQIAGGLAEASQALSGNAPKLAEAASGAEQLVSGTRQLGAGVQELAAGLRQIERGLRDGSAGAGELAAGAAAAQASAEQLAAAAQELLGGYKQAAGGLGQLGAGYAEIAAQQAGLAGELAGASEGLAALGDKYPELREDAQFSALQDSLTLLQARASGLGEQLQQLNAQTAGVAAGLEQANGGLEQAAAGQAALAEGLGAIAQGLGELAGGLRQAAAGQGRIVGGLPALEQGISELAGGQEQLAQGFAQLGDQLGELTGGLDASVDGLQQVTGGLQSAQSYLGELAAAPNRQISGWFIPEEAIQSDEFQMALDAYMSENRRLAKFDVVFEGNPYAMETMNEIGSLEQATVRALTGTAYETNSEIALGGVTSMNNDLNVISAGDYTRTVMLMLIGIGLILIFMFRSIVIPLYLMVSLIITFYTSMSIAEVLFVRILGLSGISWAVPFFGFVMLVALGVDYSIFLMDRFREYRHLSAREAILLSMKNMGTVIMSAAVILGGTFAAMLPSGVMSLLQIATIVLCGLFLYALVMLPLFIPVMVRTFGEANWWPLMRRKEQSAAQKPGDSPTARGKQTTLESH